MNKNRDKELAKDFILLTLGVVLGIIGGLVANIIHDIAMTSQYQKTYLWLAPMLLIFICYDIYIIIKKLIGSGKKKKRTSANTA